MRLRDKSALVTGAASGIGREIARLFAREGAHVVAADTNEEGLAATAEGQEWIVPRKVDVGNAGEVAYVMKDCSSRLGGLDILVCAAGVVGSKYGDGPAAECDEAAWDHVMRINLKGVWLCCKYAIPLMLSRGAGSIVTVSSATALRPPSEFFRSHAYITSKGGVVTLTKCIAAYYARHKIRANVVAPGMTDTPMSKRMQGVPEIMDYLRTHQLLGTLGDPGDVANTALFLASEESRFITGAVIAVDGGWTSHS